MEITEIEQLHKRLEIQNEEEYEKYKKKALMILTTGKRPSSKKTFVVVGGQPGSGKTRLVSLAKNELENNVVILDVTELMLMHPSYEYISKNCPELTYRLLSKDAKRLEREMLTYLSENGYNVINESTFRESNLIINKTEVFYSKGYNVDLKVMSVPKLESYGSTFYRYATALLNGNDARWVEKYGHEDSYNNVIKTMQELIRRGLIDVSNVYVRGENLPIKIFSSQERQFASPAEAIIYGRETGRKKAVDDFKAKYDFVIQILSERQPELLEKISDWKDLYEEEREKVITLNAPVQGG